VYFIAFQVVRIGPDAHMQFFFRRTKREETAAETELLPIEIETSNRNGKNEMGNKQQLAA
jgi:hypothetical protein